MSARRRKVVITVAAAALTAGCAGSTPDHPHAAMVMTSTPPLPPPEPTAVAGAPDVYAHDRAGMLSPVVRNVPARVYVPDSESNDVTVIDQRTFRKIRRFKVGALPQHVVPSWDLRTLWVNDNNGNDLVPVDPMTGLPGRPVKVADPYNLYFTPDGRFSIVMAERDQRVDFRDAHTMKLVRSVPVPCRGPNHADFSADGSFFLTACEFSGSVVKLDTARQKVLGSLTLSHTSMPQDVKLSPDGSAFFVADMAGNGVWVIDAARFKRIGFIPTGLGAHGLYPSRDSKRLYVSNRGEGTVSLISFASRRVTGRWRIPGGGSPDMGGVSADGRVLWLSGRYDREVYAISTETGKLIHRIRVGEGPHGLCVWPQPGRYSLGHTGVLR